MMSSTSTPPLTPAKIDEAIKYIRNLYHQGRTICEIYDKISVEYPGIVVLEEFDNGDIQINSEHKSILEVLHEVNLPTTATSK